MDKLLINQGSIELEVHYDAVIEKCALDIYHRYFPIAHIVEKARIFFKENPKALELNQ